MTSDTIDLADRLIEAVNARPRTGDHSKSDVEEERIPTPMMVGRFVCCGLAIAFAVAGLLLTGLDWAGREPMAPGVPTWFAAGLVLSIVFEGKIQAAQYQRQLRHDIRSQAPADAIELARIATLARRIAATQTRILEEQREMRADVNRCWEAVRPPLDANGELAEGEVVTLEDVRLLKAIDGKIKGQRQPDEG